MNELSRHIERLLLSHDCVVVPHFGGFVTLTTSAVREETEQLFFPPLRVVRFNPDLTEDDGLLIADVRTALRCTDTEAKRHIQSLVLKLRQQLLADGQVDFGTIGIFQQDEDGRVSFSPCQAGVVTPQLFGLDAFVMPKLTAAQRSGKHGSPRRALQAEEASDSRTITISINRRTLKNAVAAAAILVLCVLFSSPFDDSRQSQQASILSPDPVAVQPQTFEVETEAVQPVEAEVESKMPATEAAEIAEVLTEAAEAVAETKQTSAETKQAPATEQVQAPAEAPTKVAAEAEASQPEGNYCIVFSSNVSRKNAEHYVETLKGRGFTNARVFYNGKMNRVIVDGFLTQEEAYSKNAELHKLNEEYANTWVMAL